MVDINSDEKWFREQMKRVGISQRKLADILKLDHGALSRRFSGKGKISTIEAAQLSAVFKVPVAEIVARSMGESQLTGDGVLVKYNCGNGKLVEKDSEESYAAAIDLPEGALAARDENPQSPRYGWTFFYLPKEEVFAENLGRLAVVSCEDGSVYLGTLQRGFSDGEYNLINVAGELIGAVKAISASPVLVIQP